MKIKYILYARKSSESEDRQVASIQSQINVLKEAVKGGGLEIVDILSESQSAKEPGRPVFNTMLERIYKGEVQGIICWKLDRLARNPVDGGQINWMLQQGIIKHIKTYERSYYPTDNVLMMSVEFGMANQFVRDLSQNTKRGLRAKAERGWYPTFASLGYMHNPLKRKGEKEIIKDPERFDLVRKVFDLMLTGNYTPPQILKVAADEWGLRNRSGGIIARSTIYRILTDPFYYGLFEYPGGSGNWYRGSHEPMITEEEYDTIQSLLGRKGRPRPKTHIFAYRGLIFCGECGAMVTAEEKVKRQKNGNIHHYVYYHCTKRRNPNCSQKVIEEKELEKQILYALEQIEIPSEFHEWAIEQLRIESEKEIEDRDKILINLQKTYAICVKKIDRLIDMRANEEITEEEFLGKKSKLMKEKVRLQELLNDIDGRINNWIKKAEEIFDFAETAKGRFENGTFEEKRAILSDLGSNLILKDKKLIISIEKPLSFIEEAAKEVKAIHAGLEPQEILKNKRILAKIYSQSPKLLRGLDDVRTCIMSRLAGLDFALQNKPPVSGRIAA